MTHFSLVSGPLEIVLEMHLDIGREEVVHHREPDVLLVALVAEHAEELG